MTRPGIGIIGTGWGTRVQVPAFRHAGLEVVALAGSQARKTQRIAGELDIPYATGDWRSLLTRDDVALISIVTPPTLHCPMSCEALAAGKHVLCEKPTAFDASEAQQMLDAANAYPQQLALIDHEMRFLPSIKTARQFVIEGRIGNLRHAEVRFINSSRANLQRIWNWWSDVAQGGGILGAISSHQIDTIRFLLNDEVIAAQGYLNTFVTERPTAQSEPDYPGGKRPVTSDDFAAFQLRFARGGVAIVTASMIARKNESQSFTLYGDEGTLQCIDGRLYYARPDEAFEDMTPHVEIAIPETIKDLYPDYVEATVYKGLALYEALQGNRATLHDAATFEDGLYNQQVLDAIRASNANGQGWVTIGEA
jgi:predicted dehydrogenase